MSGEGSIGLRAGGFEDATCSEPPAGHAASPDGKETRGTSALLVLVMVSLVYVVSYMDRQLFALLLPAINSDFEMTDTEIGQLTGIAFPIVYGLMNVAVALAADRLNRVKLIGLAVGSFSVMTIGCGAAQGFWSMFVARVGVGVGEGAAPPPSLSLIADHFKGERRQWANSVYATATVAGMLIAYIGFGNVSVWLGWRAAFYGAGVLGILVGIAVLLVLRETPGRSKQSLTLGDLKGFPALFRIPSFRWVMGAAVLHTVLVESTVLWLPLFLSRSLSMSQAEIAWFLGLNYAFLGLGGILVGTYFATRLRRRSVGSPQYLASGVVVATTAAYVAAYLSGAAAFSLAMLCIVIFLSISVYGALLAFVQDVTPDDSHAKASALLFLLMQAGLGLGSLLIGVLSDALVTEVGPEESLRYALLPVIIGSGITASVCYYFAGRSADITITQGRLQNI